MGNYDISLKDLENNSSLFNNYNEFIEYCRKRMINYAIFMALRDEKVVSIKYRMKINIKK